MTFVEETDSAEYQGANSRDAEVIPKGAMSSSLSLFSVIHNTTEGLMWSIEFYNDWKAWDKALKKRRGW